MRALRLAYTPSAWVGGGPVGDGHLSKVSRQVWASLAISGSHTSSSLPNAPPWAAHIYFRTYRVQVVTGSLSRILVIKAGDTLADS